MKVTCPHCQHHIEIVATEPDVATICPECGSSLAGVLETRTFRAPAVKPLHGFELRERIGAGTFGEVWKAYDPRLDRFVAIKLPRTQSLDDEDVKSFIRESQAAAQLRHPNIVAVYEVVHEGHEVIVVSEFIDGVSLHEYLRVHKFAAREAAELAATLADALHHAHEAGVIHRDLKPANVLLDGEKRPHLTDFGLAKREGDEFTLAVDGQVLGTPGYMPPEQAAGHGHDADGRSDVYSLGVILYELLLGRRPFAGGSRLLIHQIQHDDPPAPRRSDRTIPRDLETICLKALAKSPAHRYPTAAAMADDLRRFLRGEPILARPVSRGERTWRWCRRNPAWTTAVGIAIVALLMIAGLAWNHQANAAAAHAREEALRIQKDEAQQELRQADQRATTAEEDSVKRRIVRVETEPPGANLTFYPIDDFGQPNFEKGVHSTSGTTPVKLLPGLHLVVSVLPNGDFHEVYRYVPLADDETDTKPHWHRSFDRSEVGEIILHKITILPTFQVTANMARIPGKERVPLGNGEPRKTYRIPDYYLDVTEVTRSQFRKVFPKHKAFQDNAGDDDESPMTRITHDEAVAFAERVGKLVVDDLQFEYAASHFGERRFPWGDEATQPPDWSRQPVGRVSYDRLESQPPVLGLMSNCLEFATGCPTLFIMPGGNQPARIGSYIWVRGPSEYLQNPDEVAEWGDTSARTHFQYESGVRVLVSNSPYITFRCARAVNPRLTTEPPAAK